MSEREDHIELRRRLLALLGETQVTIAERIGLHQANVSALGKKPPATLERIAIRALLEFPEAKVKRALARATEGEPWDGKESKGR